MTTIMGIKANSILLSGRPAMRDFCGNQYCSVTLRGAIRNGRPRQVIEYTQIIDRQPLFDVRLERLFIVKEFGELLPQLAVPDHALHQLGCLLRSETSRPSLGLALMVQSTLCARLPRGHSKLTSGVPDGSATAEPGSCWSTPIWTSHRSL